VRFWPNGSGSHITIPIDVLFCSPWDGTTYSADETIIIPFYLLSKVTSAPIDVSLAELVKGENTFFSIGNNSDFIEDTSQKVDLLDPLNLIDPLNPLKFTTKRYGGIIYRGKCPKMFWGDNFNGQMGEISDYFICYPLTSYSPSVFDEDSVIFIDEANSTFINPTYITPVGPTGSQGTPGIQGPPGQNGTDGGSGSNVIGFIQGDPSIAGNFSLDLQELTTTTTILLSNNLSSGGTLDLWIGAITEGYSYLQISDKLNSSIFGIYKITAKSNSVADQWNLTLELLSGNGILTGDAYISWINEGSGATGATGATGTSSGIGANVIKFIQGNSTLPGNFRLGEEDLNNPNPTPNQDLSTVTLISLAYALENGAIINSWIDSISNEKSYLQIVDVNDSLIFGIYKIISKTNATSGGQWDLQLEFLTGSGILTGDAYISWINDGKTGPIGPTGPTGEGFNTIANPLNNRIITSDGNTNSANAQSNLTFDGNTLEVLSNSSTGDILKVMGTSLVAPIFSVNNEKYIKIQSLIVNNVSTDTDIFSIPDLSGGAAFYDYYIYNATPSYRAGTIMAVWDASSDTVEYTETSTPDLNGTTSGITFSLRISSNNLILKANVTSGIWSIRLGLRLV
jgi:hypothetical protein